MVKLNEERKSLLSSMKGMTFVKLMVSGAKLGFETEKEWKTKTGRVDYVWFLDLPFNLPQRKFKRIPIVGFEVETGFRTRKHLKGNILNLLELSPAIGIVVLLEKGFKGRKDQFKGCIKAVKTYAERFEALGDILVWSETELEELKEKLKDIPEPKEGVNRSMDEVRRIFVDYKKEQSASTQKT